jgi:hypothetical protein
MDLEEIVLGVVLLIHVGQERDKWLAHVNMVMNSDVSWSDMVNIPAVPLLYYLCASLCRV